jgi:hypothetical protein
MFANVKPLIYNGQKKIDTKCHIKHFGINALLHIVPFCEGKNKKPEGFVKQKQPAIFVM